MIEDLHPQGDPAWFEARLGIPTASAYDRIITPGRLKKSAGSLAYMAELLAERMTGLPRGEEIDQGTPFSKSIAHGKEYEEEAFRAFQILTGVEARRCGFCWRDETKATGCSPDFLLSDGTGGGELKCPELRTHLAYVLMGDDAVNDYRMQVQGQIWICDLERWYFASYYPGLPLHLVEVARDDAAQAALAELVPAFCAELAAWWERLGDLGVRDVEGE